MKKVYLIVAFIFLGLSSSLIGQTQSKTIPICDFRPVRNDDTQEAHFYLGEIYGHMTSTSTTPYLMAPIDLPDGAKIVKVTLFFVDPGASSIALWVWRTNLYNGSYSTPFYMTTSGSTAGLRNQSLTGYMKVNNSGYTHVVFLAMPYDSTYQVLGVKLIYNPS